MASLLSRFFWGEKPKTAAVAKDRLLIILERERGGRNPGERDFLPDLQRDLIAVIGKYFKVDAKDIQVNLERQENLEVLEVKIELPKKTQ
jgi:cell division topological specificity factor